VYDRGRREPPFSRSGFEDRLIVESVGDAEARCERLLDDALERASDAGLEVDTEPLYGDPVETIPDYATTKGYDGIFVGHRDLSDGHERVLGSVAKGVVERSSFPVTVVRGALRTSRRPRRPSRLPRPCPRRGHRVH